MQIVVQIHLPLFICFRRLNGSWDGGVYAIDIKNGNLVWKFDANKGRITAAITIDESNQSKSLIKLHTPINQPKQYYSRSRYYSEKHDLVRHSRPYSRSYRYSNY